MPIQFPDLLLAQSGFFKIPSWQVFTNFLQAQAIRPFDTELLRLEWISLLICLIVFVNPWVIPKRWLSAVRRWLHRYAQNRSRAVWTCVLFPMVIRVALLPSVPIKPPSVHDEFSLLLMADTFRSGRLTNPTHPFWQHFETIHIFQRPTYNSMYPAGSGAIFAFGALLGNPWIGVLLSVGLMCGAICWMLQAWLPPAWAFGGAIVATLQIGIGSYWMNSYVGPAPVPAMAGALLLGAIPRFLRKPTWGTAVIFAIGVIVLVNTRPFEGTILSIICAGVALVWHYKHVLGNVTIRWRLLIPAALVIVLGGAFTCYYSWRVTGSPFKQPYVVNRDTYGWPENLAILPAQQLTYRHKILENMHILELSRRDRYTTFGRMLNSWCSRAVILWEFYVGPGLTLTMFTLPWVLRSRKYRRLFYIALFMLSLNALQLMAYPQHVSPETAIFYLLLTAGLRVLYVSARRRNILPERVMAALVLCVASGAAMNLYMEPLHIRPGTFWEWPHWPYYQDRAAILAKLEQMPGKHLIFVRYADYHSAHEEWVYNAADIDKSKIVWANSMGYKEDEKLRNYFHDRQAWIVEPDRDPTGFLPFTKKTYMQ
jgi:hypothetical protein